MRKSGTVLRARVTIAKVTKKGRSQLPYAGHLERNEIIKINGTFRFLLVTRIDLIALVQVRARQENSKHCRFSRVTRGIPGCIPGCFPSISLGCGFDSSRHDGETES